MLKAKKIKDNKTLENLLRKRKVRTQSGVAPIAVLTKPYPCPGKCVYCPSENKMPKSYLSNEPAVMRAILNKFDPYKQVQTRLKALKANGHSTDKVEIIVMGGTWTYFPKQYQTWYIKRLFDSLNGRTSPTLEKAQKMNEKEKHRCVGMTLETRPDYINNSEIKRMRQLGCTRVEMGVQHTDDAVLKLNKRGHDRQSIIKTTKLLKDAGFKVCYHMMPNLPGSTPAKDIKMFKELFSDPDLQPDMLKIYPCVVTKGSALYKWWKKGEYKPYSDKRLFELLLKIKQLVPYHCRIIRLIRDIPSESIEAGNKISNLREMLQKALDEKGLYCKCIRCREIGHSQREDNKNGQKIKMFIDKYHASGGTEYFLNIASPDRKTLYAFLRLRLPGEKSSTDILELKKAALVREVHTYGHLVPIDSKDRSASQHRGLGKRLMAEAEKIACQSGYKKMAVISGIGVREYYKKLGYNLEGTYMVKDL